MRDILLFCLFFLVLGKAFREPIYGVLLWMWVSFMNPHRLTWGIAYGFPFAAITALVAIPLAFTAKRKINPFASPAMVFLCCLIAWMAVTTFFAIMPDDAWREYNRFLKVSLMVLVGGMLLVDRAAIDKAVIVIALSFGFYGVKGGLFTIATGGSFRVWGPEGSFIGGNNEIALALLMITPFFYYLAGQTAHPLAKKAWLAAMALTVVAALGSQSRGAFLAAVAMMIPFWLKSRQKLPILFAMVIGSGAILLFMPESWFERMHSIENYQSDGSAMGRINAWTVAWRIALDRLTAGGFNHWSVETFALYAPNPGDVHDVHSIYFEILGEHGFPGFLLYLLTWGSVVMDMRWIMRHTQGRESVAWAAELTKMINVSLIAYAVGGAFLGLAYFDLPWNLAMIVVATKTVVKNQLLSADETPQHAAPTPKRATFVRGKAA